MQQCPKCHALVMPNSRFCERCGLDLSKPTEAFLNADSAASDNQEPLGSLRDRIPLLSGTAKRLKVRMQNIMSSNDEEKKDKGEEKPSINSFPRDKNSKTSIFFTILLGIGVLALWVWILANKVKSKFFRLFK